MRKIEHSLERHVGRLALRIARLRGISKRFANVRLSIVLGGIPLIWACFTSSSNWIHYPVPLFIFVLFCFVLKCHGRIRQSINRCEVLKDLKSANIARMRLDWERIPAVPAFQISGEHPFGTDLDISGEHSVHRLIDMTVSREGGRRLLDWLLQERPEPGVSLKRQKMVAELSGLSVFREKLFVHAMSVPGAEGGRLDTQSILKWLETRRSITFLIKALVPLSILAAVNWIILGLSVLGIIPQFFIITFIFYIAILVLLQFEMAKVFQDAVTMETTLSRILCVFLHLEKHGFAGAPNMADLCKPFLDEKSRPSTKLKQISRVVSAISVRSNPVVWLLLNGILPWDACFARLLERYRGELSVSLPKWMEVLAEVEALSSLANFSYLNPDYCYPDLLPPREKRSPQGDEPELAGMIFTAQNIGHPLVSSRDRICNSLSLDDHDRIVLITGSNMAGKSTFLRTLGVNLCLAYAGAPVCADALQTGFFRIFACMRINDSVTDGFSFFYAEVKRLKMLLLATQVENDLPVLFLLDEIFRGTNNRERFIGSRAFIQALSGQSAIGAIASHDLELVKLAEENSAISNFHFREEVRDNRMIFDYKLHPGPCPTTNALKIMAMAGLPV